MCCTWFLIVLASWKSKQLGATAGLHISAELPLLHGLKHQSLCLLLSPAWGEIAGWLKQPCSVLILTVTTKSNNNKYTVKSLSNNLKHVIYS